MYSLNSWNPRRNDCGFGTSQQHSQSWWSGGRQAMGHFSGYSSWPAPPNTCRPSEWGTVPVSMETLWSDIHSDSNYYRAPSGIVKNSWKFGNCVNQSVGHWLRTIERSRFYSANELGYSCQGKDRRLVELEMNECLSDGHWDDTRPWCSDYEEKTFDQMIELNSTASDIFRNQLVKITINSRHDEEPTVLEIPELTNDIKANSTSPCFVVRSGQKHVFHYNWCIYGQLWIFY